MTISNLECIFQDRLMLSHIFQKFSAKAFYWCGWTYADLENISKYLLALILFTPKTDGELTQIGDMSLFCIPDSFYVFFSCIPELPISN